MKQMVTIRGLSRTVFVSVALAMFLSASEALADVGPAPYLPSGGVGDPEHYQMLEVTPGTLAYTILSGQTLTNVDMLRVSNIGSSEEAGSMNFEAESDANWLIVQPTNGSIENMDSAELEVSYDTEGLTADASVKTYTGNITLRGSHAVTGDPAQGSPQQVEVTITVNPKPRLRVSKNELSNSVVHGYDAVSQRFDVWNDVSFNSMNFEITKDVGWLKTSITKGVSTGQRHTVEITYSTTGLKVGRTNAIITVTASNAQSGVVAVGSPQYIEIEMRVQPIAELLCDTFEFINSFQVRKGGSVAPQSFRISNGCSDPQGILGYEISSDVSWISVSPNSGTSGPDTSHNITVSFDIAGLAPGQHFGTILIEGRDKVSGIDAINSPRRIVVEMNVEPTKPLDFMGDGVAELVVYHEQSGGWHILNMEGRSTSVVFGASGYIPAPGDYDGDGRSEIGVYRTSSGSWYSKPIDSYTILVVGKFGGEGFVPVRGDFDGDGRQDFAVYHQTSGRWFVISPDGNLILWNYLWGGSGFVPFARDFTGDGKADLTVYDEATGNWYVMSVAESPHGAMVAWEYPWGGPGFTPVTADFDGDGLSDLAAYYHGWWFITSLTEGVIEYASWWGGEGFIPLAGDYNGDGVADLAVYEESTGRWYIRSVAGDIIVNGIQWGGEGYTPIGM